jgi:membrane-associated phospholipid phosphatase
MFAALTIPFHQKQLEFMTDLARHRIEALDPFFRFLAYFDSPYFFITLIPIVWLGFSYQWGLRVFYWLTLNNLVITVAKHLLMWPRPSQDVPEIALMHPLSFGCPSDGAQGCLFLGAMLIYCWRTPVAWAVGIFYILLISFSRLYLGVHYPIDVLAGWILAAILFLLFLLTEKPIERLLHRLGPTKTLLLSLAIPLALLLLLPRFQYVIGALVGVGLGTYISLKYHLFLPRPKDLNEGINRALIGLALIYLIAFLWPADRTFAKSFIISLFMSTVASPICRWFFAKKP